MAWTSWFWSPFRRLGWRFWLTFLGAWVAAQAIEFAADHLARQHREGEEVASSLVEATGLYQKLATRPRNPRVNYTSLVVIDHERDIPGISAANVCAERDFLAGLLVRLADAGAKAVVIDKYFGRTSCPGDDPGTRRLVATIGHLRRGEPVDGGHAARAPMSIVVGLQATPADERERKRPDVTSFVQPPLEFPPANVRDQQGLCNVDADPRRLPLQWTVYPDAASVRTGSVQVLDTLAFAAARQASPRLLEESPKLADLVTSGRQPFIGFLLPEQFAAHRHFASEIACGQGLSSPPDWPACEGRAPVPDEVRGRVVLVAEESREDIHNTIVGPMAGYYLQANYVESLLDDRFLMPAWPGVNTAFSLAFLLLLELILLVCHESPGRAVLGVLTLVVVFGLLIWESIANVGVYVDPSWVTLSYVTIRLAHIVYSRMPHGAGGAHPVEGTSPPPTAPAADPPLSPRSEGN